MNSRSFKGLQDWHNSGDFETIINLANEKYMTANWKSMGEWAPKQVGTQWSAKVDNVDIITLPNVGAPFADGKLEGVAGFSGFSGTIPRLTKSSIITAADIRKVMEYEYEDGDFIDEIRNMYLKKAENQLGGFHLQLQSWMYEALTSGAISITSAMSQGLPYKADFKVPSANKYTVGTKWFTVSGSTYTEVSGSDPIKDLQEMVSKADDAGANVDHFKMSKALYERFITHSKVITAVAARLSDNSNYKPTKAEIKLQLASGFDILPIEVIDEKTFVDKNGISQTAGDHFDKKVVVLCGSGAIFSVKNSIGNFDLIKTSTVDTSLVEEGRIGVRNRYDDRALSEITDYELFAVPVLKNPNNLFIATVI